MTGHGSGDHAFGGARLAPAPGLGLRAPAGLSPGRLERGEAGEDLRLHAAQPRERDEGPDDRREGEEPERHDEQQLDGTDVAEHGGVEGGRRETAWRPVGQPAER